jgi:CBS domain-containing protein
MLLPLLMAVLTAHGFTVLTLKRSILTEKISRRGFHLTREYAADPLETLFVREVMRKKVTSVQESARRSDFTDDLHKQLLYPVVDSESRLQGVITRTSLMKFLRTAEPDDPARTLMQRNPIVAYPDESLRPVVYRMAGTGKTRLPVVDREDAGKLVGMVSLNDLLFARTRDLQEEQSRERVLPRSRKRVPPKVMTSTPRT